MMMKSSVIPVFFFFLSPLIDVSGDTGAGQGAHCVSESILFKIKCWDGTVGSFAWETSQKHKFIYFTVW